MGNGLYTSIGYCFVWCVKYIFVPLGVAVIARIVTEKLLRPQPGRQKKKRSNKTRFKK